MPGSPFSFERIRCSQTADSLAFAKSTTSPSRQRQSGRESTETISGQRERNASRSGRENRSTALPARLQAFLPEGIQLRTRLVAVRKNAHAFHAATRSSTRRPTSLCPRDCPRHDCLRLRFQGALDPPKPAQEGRPTRSSGRERRTSGGSVWESNPVALRRQTGGPVRARPTVSRGTKPAVTQTSRSSLNRISTAASG
jgi:hypothetical protein